MVTQTDSGGAVVKKAGARHGCHNVTHAEGYWSQDGWHRVTDGVTYGIPKFVWTPHQMTRDCQWKLDNPGHPACEGCVK